MRNDFQLDRKYVLVSGGTSGIGAKCCALISDYGGIPICLGRDERKLYDLQKTVPSMIPIQIDLQNLDSIENSLAEKLQGIKVDGFVHSAGIELTRPIRNVGHDDLTRVFRINLLSGILLAKMLSKKSIVPEKGSSFIFISSIMSLVGEAGKTGYAATKGGLASFAKSLALELAGRKIRVNSISPGSVETAMSKQIFESIGQEKANEIVMRHPLGLGKPEDVALACIYLLSDAAKWVTGINLVVDGGYTAS